MGPPALQIGPGVTPYDSQLSTPRHATRHSSGGPDSPAGLRSHQLRGSFSDFNTPPSGGSSISHAGSLMSPGGLLSPSIVMSPGGHLVSVSPVSLSLNHYGVELAHTNNPSAGPALWDGSPPFGILGCLSCPTRAFTQTWHITSALLAHEQTPRGTASRPRLQQSSFRIPFWPQTSLSQPACNCVAPGCQFAAGVWLSLALNNRFPAEMAVTKKCYFAAWFRKHFCLMHSWAVASVVPIACTASGQLCC